MITLRSLVALCLAVAAARSAAGCSDDVVIGLDRPPDAGTGEGGAGGSGFGGSAGSGAVGEAGAGPCMPATCAGAQFACGDCIDNDADGNTDADDGECLGPCDDTEDSYTLGIESGGTSCREDCAFDRDSGSGNDGCVFSHTCDEESMAPDYPPTGRASCEYDPNGSVPGTNLSCAELRMTQPDTCLDVCLPLTPNGCDCFGCCELPARSGRYVWLGGAVDDGADCNPASLGDSSVCRPCTPVPSCLNPCDECEVCAGNAPPAASCSGGTIECDAGRQACGGDQMPPCVAGYYCITGCCVPQPT